MVIINSCLHVVLRELMQEPSISLWFSGSLALFIALGGNMIYPLDHSISLTIIASSNLSRSRRTAAAAAERAVREPVITVVA